MFAALCVCFGLEALLAVALALMHARLRAVAELAGRPDRELEDLQHAWKQWKGAMGETLEDIDRLKAKLHQRDKRLSQSQAVQEGVGSQVPAPSLSPDEERAEIARAWRRRA